MESITLNLKIAGLIIPNCHPYQDEYNPIGQLTIIGNTTWNRQES